MKKAADYLHLYINANIQVEYGFENDKAIGILTGFRAGAGWEVWPHATISVRMKIGERVIPKIVRDDLIKPILRPLSDILNTESFMVYKMYFEKETALDFSGDNGSVYYNPKQVRVQASHALRIFNGQDYETGDFTKVCQLVPYLLSKGFDLFNLIPEGLAIDKTKLHG